PIYEIYEGRRGWPRLLRESATARLKKRVNVLLTKSQDPKDPLYGERWAKLRQYPTDVDGRTPTATAPTLLGNVLASYEQYPLQRHGMDATFYWPRLWLTLTKDVQDDIDNSWAPADSLLYTSAGLAGSAIIYALVAAVPQS